MRASAYAQHAVAPMRTLVPTLEYLHDKHALSGDTKCSSLIYRW